MQVEVRQSSVLSGPNYLELSGLKSSRRYDIWVKAETSAGYGPSSKVTSVVLSSAGRYSSNSIDIKPTGFFITNILSSWHYWLYVLYLNVSSPADCIFWWDIGSPMEKWFSIGLLTRRWANAKSYLVSSTKTCVRELEAPGIQKIPLFR